MALFRSRAYTVFETSHVGLGCSPLPCKLKDLSLIPQSLNPHKKPDRVAHSFSIGKAERGRFGGGDKPT